MTMLSTTKPKRKQPSPQVLKEREEKKARKCKCENTEEVRSANGAVLYGWRCRQCRKQFQRLVCTGCSIISELPANPERTKWTCRKCVKAALDEATGKAAE